MGNYPYKTESVQDNLRRMEFSLEDHIKSNIWVSGIRNIYKRLDVDCSVDIALYFLGGLPKNLTSLLCETLL